MPINRAPFNALVDDDGSNTKGTVWNKAQIQSVLLDPIDATVDPEVLTVASVSVPTWIAPTFTTLNRGVRVLVFNSSADMYIPSVNLPGNAAPNPGDRLYVTNVGTVSAVAWLYPEYSNQVAVGRLHNMVTSGPTPINAGGSALYVFDGSLQRYRLAFHQSGTPIAYTPTVTPSAGALSTTAVAFYFTVTGNTITIDFYLSGAQSGAAAASIACTLPQGYTQWALPYQSMWNPARCASATAGWGMAGFASGNMTLYADAGGSGWNIGNMWITGRASALIQ